MGLFPHNWLPQYSWHVLSDQTIDEFDYEKRDMFFKHLETTYQIPVNGCWHNIEKCSEIDRWILENTQGRSYYYQMGIDEHSTWLSAWCFDLEEDAVKFKLRWG